MYWVCYSCKEESKVKKKKEEEEEYPWNRLYLFAI